MLAIALGILLISHLVYLLLGIKFFEQPPQEALQSSAGRFYIWGVNFYLSMASQLLPFVIGWFLYRFVVQSHEQALPLGPERRVGGIEEAKAQIKGARGAQGKERRRTDKGKQ
jgi:hypothetical protein